MDVLGVEVAKGSGKVQPISLRRQIVHGSPIGFKLDAAEARRISPLFWPVTHGHVLDAVVGGDESLEFLRQSKSIADGWREKGIETRYEAVPGMNHFTICDPLTDPNSAMTKRLVDLARRT